ncbi:B-cell receptor CD22-like [Sphaeramia orbicularis]|uniref:B-cell receptor CD22-like n=1 Tax=Sphaeramia orbicularis TaxID=375764 RepID=UPI00117D8E37|nr:B-cell receptor CD22-like [Sphaeramia orbicularis]
MYSTETVSCGVEGYEKFSSPSVFAPTVPSVSFSPSGEIIEGSSVTLTCTSDANPPVTKYTWYKRGNNQPQSRGEGQQFVLSSITSTDSGSYSCVAWNSLGWKMSEYVYTDVKYPPRLPSVSVSPSGQIVEGSSVTLTCTSDANPPVTKYTWYKRGDNQLQSRGEGQQFVLSFINSSDSGSYSCQTENSLGQKMSEYVYIDVKYPPRLPSVSVSPSGQIVEGSSVTLTCTSDANPPVTKYTWYKRGNNQLQSRGEGQQFVLSFINSSDSGSYSCQTENSLGQKMSEYVYIDVKYPPRLPSVSVSPSGQIVEGSSVTLTCTSDANPPVTKYTWYKRGNNRLQSRGEGQQFVLSFIKSSDSGLYSCVAENSLERKMSKFVHIDVKYPPRLPSVSVSPSGQIVQGSSVTLTCTSDANPPVTKYTWYKEDEDSPKASGHNFTITDFRSEHSGNYYCEAQNSRGRQNSTSHLITVSGETKFILNIVKLSLLVLLLSTLIFTTLCFRKKKIQQADPELTPVESIEVNEKNVIYILLCLSG